MPFFVKLLLTINIDGASRGNPGPSGIGVVIIKNNLIITEYNEFIGEKTNNQAEYVALKKALQIASIFDDEITVLSDSKLVVSQRNNRYRLRNKQLKIIFREISNLEKQFRAVIYKYIPRAKNQYADFLANRAIDEHLYNDINNKSMQ
ncbi:MAG: ribonuclease HI family protein [Nitrososphaeraceae archaeon]|jgi:ribonuclease HI